MRRFAIAALLLTACATTPPPQTAKPIEQPRISRSPNALTAVASAPRVIAEPKIRVGMLSDQSTVVFPRTSDGYALVTGKGPSTLKRGFTASAPLANATVRYAVQMSAISDQTSANALAEKLRGETGLRVDVTFDPASGTHKVLAGDFESSDAATPVRAQLTDRGYGRDLLVVRRPSDQPFPKRIEIVDDEGDRAILEGDSVLILPLSADTVVIDKQPYRGGARLFVNPRGLLNVINELPFEEYLYGVVPAEMPASWPAEALAAQAVCARSYALTSRSTGLPWDVFADVRSQVYRGVLSEVPASTAAVRATRGKVVTVGGQVAQTFFFSTSGGRTAANEEGFGGSPISYLRSVDDPYDNESPVHTWTARFTRGEADRKLGSLVTGRLRGLEVATRSPSGRAATVLVRGSGGDRTVSAASVRTALGLRSTWLERISGP